MSIKVMLADDHSMIREGLKQLLEFDGSIQVIAQAGDGEECLEKLCHVYPDVLLLDINMPKKNGLEVLEEICPLSARMIVNQVSMQMQSARIKDLINRMRDALDNNQ